MLKRAFSGKPMISGFCIALSRNPGVSPLKGSCAALDAWWRPEQILLRESAENKRRSDDLLNWQVAGVMIEALFFTDPSSPGFVGGFFWSLLNKADTLPA